MTSQTSPSFPALSALSSAVVSCRAVLTLLIACLSCLPAHASAAQAPEETSTPAPLVVILDASGSMWGQIQGENKIVIARRVLGELIDDLPDEQRVGLVAYGHRREGDCSDIETIQEVGIVDRRDLKDKVESLNPRGKTPITKSLERAIELAEREGVATTIVLVSDGLETCDGDPCAAVAAARDAASQDATFLLHVVGFDVGGEDTSSLQCAARAGGGLFLAAEDAVQLSGALERAVTLTADVPAGRLMIRGVRNGALHDVAVVVDDATTGEMVGGARTYASELTNPSSIPLPDGVFDVEVQAVGIDGDIRRRFRVEIADGATVERTEDFSTGELRIATTRNGALSDAVFDIRLANDGKRVAGGRTRTDARSNPAVVTLTAGTYDIEITSVEIEGGPRVSLGRVEVSADEPVELAHDWRSGLLRVATRRGDELADATVQVYRKEGGSVGGARTYTAERSNPATFVLEPGEYRLVVQEIRGPRTELEVTVPAEGTVEHSVDFDDL